MEHWGRFLPNVNYRLAAQCKFSIEDLIYRVLDLHVHVVVIHIVSPGMENAFQYKHPLIEATAAQFSSETEATHKHRCMDELILIIIIAAITVNIQ